MKTITPCLWFDKNALEACQFYTWIFPNSKIKHIQYYDESNPHGTPGEVLTVEFNLMGNDFLALNGGPVFKFTPAISFMIPCKNQVEINNFYEKLSYIPEAEECGWLQDKYGVSWQLIPEDLDTYLKDPKKSSAVMKALLNMKKINIDELLKAYNS